MASLRLPMRTIREILRLRFDRRASIREIALSCKLAASTVGDYVARATVAKLSWPLTAELERVARMVRPGTAGRKGVEDAMTR